MIQLYEYGATVIKNYDGDTITVDFDYGRNHFERNCDIRFGLIDTPELRRSHSRFWDALIDTGELSMDQVTQLGRDAKAFVGHYCPPGGPLLVRTHYDKSGKYGRPIATIFAPEPDEPPPAPEADPPPTDSERFPSPLWDERPIEDSHLGPVVNLNRRLLVVGLALPTDW